MIDYFKACEEGDIQKIRRYVKKRFSVNCKNENGSTPLMIAIYYGHFDIVKLLIKNGADTEVKDHSGFNPLIVACYNGRLEIVRFLVEEINVDIDSVNEFNETPLSCSSRRGHFEITKYLIEKGVREEIENREGKCYEDYLSVVQRNEISEIKKDIFSRRAMVKSGKR